MCGNLSLFLSDYLPQLACLLFLTCRSVNKFHKVSHLELQRCKLHRRCHKFQYSRKRHQLSVALIIYNAIFFQCIEHKVIFKDTLNTIFGGHPLLFKCWYMLEVWAGWGGDGGLRSPVVNHWPPTQQLLSSTFLQWDIRFSRHVILNISVQQKSPTDLQSDGFFWNK